MDREQAHGVRSLLLGERLELLRPQRLLVLDEADEGGEIGAADRLVFAREPPELAQVREPTGTIRAREDREVVVVLREDLLADPLEPARDDTRTSRSYRWLNARRSCSSSTGIPSGSVRSSAVKSGRCGAPRRRSTSVSFETPTNGDASTVASATSS